MDAMTFSIVALDPATGEAGVAVQSKFLCVGAVVPWAKAGVGAIATQAWANPRYGPEGLALLEAGLSAEEVVAALTAADPGAADRQLGVVDATGRAASYTGPGCLDWAGGVVGENFACQGNILVGQATVQAMADTFRTTPGDLAERLTMPLQAGAAAGGDRRGLQSAALYIAKADAGYLGNTDRYVDIRVDDHPDPITELRRILATYRLLFFAPNPASIVDIAGDTQDFLLAELARRGLHAGDPAAGWTQAAQDALTTLYSTENVEGRMCPYGRIDTEVVEYLRTARAADQA